MQGAERHTGRTFPASSPDERTYSAKIPRFRGNLSLHRISDLYILSYSLPKSKQKRTVKRENFHISQKNVLFKINKFGSKTRCRSAFLDLKSAILRKKCSGTVPQSRSGAFFFQIPRNAAPMIPASLPSLAIFSSVSGTNPPPYCSALTIGSMAASRLSPSLEIPPPMESTSG